MSATGTDGMVARERRAVGHDRLLGEVRRADWRFLLPEPELGDVAYLAPHDPELVTALGHVSASLTLLEAAPPGDGEPAAAADVVVVGSGNPACVERAAAILRPGGWLYAETAGPRARRWQRVLERSGLEAISAYWLWPSAPDCREIADLGAPAALRHVLGRRHGGARARLAGVLARARLLRYAVPAAAVIARRAGGSGIPSAANVVLTPRFRMSRHVVTLQVDGDARPMRVVKTPRVAGDGDALGREVDVLRVAQDVVPGATPRIIAFHDRRAHPLLVETALVGRPLRTATLGSERDAAVAAVADLLARLARGTAHPPPAGWYERLIAAPLRSLDEMAGDAEIARLVDRSLETCDVLRDASLAAVLEHGDLADPNVMALDAGGIGVLDWETGRRDGLPTHDLFFFLGHVARASLCDAYAGPDAWAGPVVARYAAATGVDPELLGALHVACWARSVASLGARLAAGEESPDAGAAHADWLGGQRHTGLWREALDHTETITRGWILT